MIICSHKHLKMSALGVWHCVEDVCTCCGVQSCSQLWLQSCFHRPISLWLESCVGHWHHGLAPGSAKQHFFIFFSHKNMTWQEERRHGSGGVATCSNWSYHDDSHASCCQLSLLSPDCWLSWECFLHSSENENMRRSRWLQRHKGSDKHSLYDRNVALCYRHHGSIQQLLNIDNDIHTHTGDNNYWLIHLEFQHTI